MKDEVVTCDICGKLLAPTHDGDPGFYTLSNSVNLTYIYSGNHDSFDLCPHCFKRMNRYLKVDARKKKRMLKGATKNSHFAKIAMMCREIEESLKTIKRAADSLNDIYGISLCDIGIQSGEYVHLLTGIELIEQVFKQKADESRMDQTYHKKCLLDNDVRWLQLSKPDTKDYMQANYYGDALVDLEKEDQEYGSCH